MPSRADGGEPSAAAAPGDQLSPHNLWCPHAVRTDKGQADPLRGQATLIDLTCDYHGQEKGSRESHTRETANRSMTRYSSQGLESLNDQDLKVMGTKCPTLETKFDSTGFPPLPYVRNLSLL